ncbi:MAG: IgA Peptidase M64 [Myxococcaceae bacterium]
MLALSLVTLLAATPNTLRVDYFHTGDEKSEVFSLDRVVVEPLPWPGNPDQPIDDTNLGKYMFEVRDLKTNKPVYSRGFGSIYGEWETTAEAKEMHRTFHESVRFPRPDGKVQLSIMKRDARNLFHEVWTTVIDPSDMFVDSSKPSSPGTLLKVLENGPSAKKVDLLILGDGYTAAERPKFEKDAKKLADILFSYSPFKERKADFNVWALCPASDESGISRPSTGQHRRSRVGATYDAFGSERYILSFDNKSFRDVASFAPYEFVEILVNNKTYGGGGIYNLYSTVAADSFWAPYLFVHEFGHHFAALADEYFTSDTAYEPAQERLEPWEPNATALLDPKNLKWKDLVEKDTPLPTSWDKEKFETRSHEIQKLRREIRAKNQPESEMDKLFVAQQKEETELLSSQKYAGKVGAFEGCNYESKGFYRPQVDCVMFSRNQVPFCKVCQRGIDTIIDLYAGKKR